tara:strand:- start:9 stop:395 length:387 start_codon:yes stop_codon:yes gene_type:complete
MKSSLFYKIFLSIILITLLFFSFFTSAKQASSERLKKLTMEIRCMTCQSQSIYDSESDFALSIKNLIQEKITEGKTDTEIILFLSERYGEYILFKPLINKKTYVLWLFPFILLGFSILLFSIKLKKNN